MLKSPIHKSTLQRKRESVQDLTRVLEGITNFQTTQGNKYLKSILFQVGETAGRSKDEAFHNLYTCISGRSSKLKVFVDSEHKVIRVFYNILSTGEY